MANDFRPKAAEIVFVTIVSVTVILRNCDRSRSAYRARESFSFANALHFFTATTEITSIMFNVKQ